MKYQFTLRKSAISKMNLKNFLLIFLVISLFPLFTACSSTPSEDEKISIVGNWQNDREVEEPPDYFVDLNLEDNGHFILTVGHNPDYTYLETVNEKSIIKGIYLYDGKVLELKVDEVDNSSLIWGGNPDMVFKYTLSDNNNILTLNNSNQFLDYLDEPLVLIKVDINAS